MLHSAPAKFWIPPFACAPITPTCAARPILKRGAKVVPASCAAPRMLFPSCLMLLPQRQAKGLLDGEIRMRAGQGYSQVGQQEAEVGATTSMVAKVVNVQAKG